MAGGGSCRRRCFGTASCWPARRIWKLLSRLSGSKLAFCSSEAHFINYYCIGFAEGLAGIDRPDRKCSAVGSENLNFQLISYLLFENAKFANPSNPAAKPSIKWQFSDFLGLK